MNRARVSAHITRGNRRGPIHAAMMVGLMGIAGCSPNVPEAAATVEVGRGCSLVDELGMGFLIDNGLILASAHVVAGHDTATVTLNGRTVEANVVAFDPDNDLAYLRPHPSSPVASTFGRAGWPLADRAKIADMADNTPASVYVERDDQLTRLDAMVIRRIQIDTEDIYIDDDVTRPGWELRYAIEPGDSGAAVVVDGEIIGVVWARSREADDRAYAIDPVRGGDLINEQLEVGQLELTPDIDLTRC